MTTKTSTAGRGMKTCEMKKETLEMSGSRRGIQSLLLAVLCLTGVTFFVDVQIDSGTMKADWNAGVGLFQGVSLVLCAGVALYYSQATAWFLTFLATTIDEGRQIAVSHVQQTSMYAVLDVLCFGVAYFVADALIPNTLLLLPCWTGLLTCLFISLLDFTLGEQTKLSVNLEELGAEVDSKPFMREERGKAVLGSKLVESKKDKVASLPVYNWSEIEKHNKPKDIWVVCNGLVYNITPFFPKHPGGRKALITMGGRDASDVLNEFHPENAFKILPKFLIGRLSPSNVHASDTDSTEASSDENEIDTNEAILKDYRKIRQIMLHLNLFETDYSFYAKKAMICGIMFLTAMYLLVTSSSFLVHMVSAALLGLFWQQAALVAHDLGHTGVTHNRNLDYYLAILVANIFGGISMGWWKLSHNVHHVNCNSERDDPDIQHMPVFAVSPRMLTSFFSSYHKHVFVFDPVAKFLLSYQHFLFYPVMALARVNLYIQSWTYLLTNPTILDGRRNMNVEFKYTEFAALAIFFSWLGLALSFLPGWSARVVYILFAHAVSGILHVQICLSHFSMQTYQKQFKDEVQAEVEKLVTDDTKSPVVEEGAENWVLLQMNTTMNVENSPLMDFFHGGLNFQIEHHLYPRLPRHNLRFCSGLVKQMCKKHNIVHRSLSFVDANVDLIQRLQHTAQKARHQHVDYRDFSKSELYDGLNLVG